MKSKQKSGAMGSSRKSKKQKQETGSDSVQSVHPVDADKVNPVAAKKDDHALVGNVRSLREGAQYSLKIKSFSLLLDTKIETCESRVFEIGGYKWKLSLYPNGNKERKGNGHISFYLKIVDTETFPLGWEVNVNFNLYVFNHIQDKYSATKDDEGEIRRFHGMKTEWGFDKFLPLGIINDAFNGYLLDDCCVFGAEVFVIKTNGKGDCLSIVKDPVNNTYTWKIDRWSTLVMFQEVIRSEEFAVGDHKWKLVFYPKGNGTAKGKFVSLYLELADSEALPPQGKLYVEHVCRIRDQIHGKDFEDKAHNWFCGSRKIWGYPDFMALSELNDLSLGYVANGTVIVESEITLISCLKDF